MRQGSFNFSDPDGDDVRPFDRKPDFFKKPAIPTEKPAETPDKPEQTSQQAQAPIKKEPLRKKSEKPVILTVTGLNRSIKFALADFFPGRILVEGEISNYKEHGSGHVYLSLKDQTSTIAAVMWRTTASKLKFIPENGMSVIATAKLEVYEPQGKYQLILEKLEPAGVGALELAFRQLADKLEKEGLFEHSRKKPLPPYPMTIAIITSETGAAVQDICQTLKRRWPFARKLLYPVTVQGSGAAQEIALAIKDINARNNELKVDVMIVGRGGGSLEDLWPFNEELVARAIAGSQIPIISGVGHEIDTTISDMVADVRAATPTAAAELAVPVAHELKLNLQEYSRVLSYDIKEIVGKCSENLEMIIGRPFFAQPMSMLNIPRQQLDELQVKLENQIITRISRNRQILEHFHAGLRKIEPHSRIGSLKLGLENTRHQLAKILNSSLTSRNNVLGSLQMRLERKSPERSIAIGQQQLVSLSERLNKAITNEIKEANSTMNQYQQLLKNLDHRQVLKRGYTVTRLKNTDTIIKASKDLVPDTIVTTEFIDGTVDSKIQ